MWRFPEPPIKNDRCKSAAAMLQTPKPRSFKAWRNLSKILAASTSSRCERMPFPSAFAMMLVCLQLKKQDFPGASRKVAGTT
jgi:hypothetical protein